MNRGWIFDLDGTLVDSLPGIATSLNVALASQGLSAHDPAQVRTFIGDGAEMLVRRALKNSDEVTFAAVLDNFRDHYAAHWQDGTVPYDGIPELLRKLRANGDCLAVLSNKPHPFTMTIVETLFPHTFGWIVGQRPGIPHKPDPTGLWEILHSPTWSAKRSVLIGDSTIDLQTAQAAGIESIAVTWGYHDRNALLEAKPTHLIDDVSALAEWLRQ